MGTHPIFESDFDCLTEVLKMTNEINMNVEEDAELRELLISNLESRGVLSRIKADLRAAIFQCLDEKSQSEESGISAADQVPLSLCTDLFESLGLHSTNKVLQTETRCDLSTRAELADQFGLSGTVPDGKALLHYALNQQQQEKKTQHTTTSSNAVSPVLTGISDAHLEERARVEFAHYDHGQFNCIHLDDAGSALMDLFPCIPEHHATFLFSAQTRQELTFEEWFAVVCGFSQMCVKVVNSDKTTGNKDASGLDFDLLNKTADDGNLENGDHPLNNQKTEEIMTSRTNYSNDFSEFHSKTQEVTEGRLPDSDSEDVSTTDNFTFSKNHTNTTNNHQHELTEDFSVRSDDASKYADFIENV